MLAVSVKGSFRYTGLRSTGSMDTLAGRYGSTTCTLTVAFTLPCTAVAVMVAVPAASGVTTQCASSPSTEAIFGSLLFQVISLIAVSAGSSDASSASVSFMYSSTVPLWFRFTAETFHGSTTCTTSFSVCLP